MIIFALIIVIVVKKILLLLLIQKIYLINVLQHNKNFIFYCNDCNISLCSLCDLDFHNDNNHSIQQLLSFRKNQNYTNNIFSGINKQRYFLDKIKEMINKLIQNLENDLTFKEIIKDNYENNKYNYQSIQNFNNLKIRNNEYFEKILDNIINKYDEFERDKNNKFNENLLINTILSPFYYSLMINNNQDFNNNLNN